MKRITYWPQLVLGIYCRQNVRPFCVCIINPIYKASLSPTSLHFLLLRTNVQLGSTARLVCHQGLLWLVRVSPAVFLRRDVDAHIRHYICTSGDAWTPLFLVTLPLKQLVKTFDKEVQVLLRISFLNCTCLKINLNCCCYYCAITTFSYTKYVFLSGHIKWDCQFCVTAYTQQTSLWSCHRNLRLAVVGSVSSAHSWPPLSLDNRIRKMILK